jgi:beta-lactamase class A
MLISRRRVLTASLLAGSGLFSLRLMAADATDSVQARLAELEGRWGGRLGVAILDTGSGQLISHRGDQRFAMCSTFKCLAAAFVLARVDAGQDSLSRRIAYGKDQIVPYSPATEAHAGKDGMTLAQLCEAAITLSDNTAANLLLDSFGGPAGLTAWVRTQDDLVTRLDRREPQLNENKADDLRDTTTPISMLYTLKNLVLGKALSEPSREQLIAWLVANTTGDKKLRAGLPKNWRVGDKTGSGARNASNDIAVIWPPQRAPIIVTTYYSEGGGSDDQRSAVIADVGRLIATL